MQLGAGTQITLIDLTALVVAAIAAFMVTGSSTSWPHVVRPRQLDFFGFKLHLFVNGRGELPAVRLTRGNVDDRKPIPILVKRFFGKLRQEVSVSAIIRPTAYPRD